MNSKRRTTTGPPPPVANPDEIAIDDEDDNADQEESTTSSNTNDLSFIDTRPKRSKLTVPEPGNSDEFLERLGRVRDIGHVGWKIGGDSTK
jgi:hypothetical protein